MASKCPLVIVGGGSAGFAAATMANYIGLKTALIKYECHGKYLASPVV
jgi:pyruvate/2-oxoglutarate dehydrogenase complex dihydrolipoamide dehydrogenase (E3) component